MRKQVKAFIFDLDGVITDTAEFHYLAWKKLAEEIGIDFDRDDNEKLKGISRMESLERILQLGAKERSFTDVEKTELAGKKNSYYVQLIKQLTPEDRLPGMGELLVEIRESGYKIGLASVSKNALTVIRALRLDHQFDAIIDAATVRKGKPDPEIFLRAAEELGVLPEECIGIEDAEAGVEAIKHAGMFAVGIGSPQVLNKADVVYEHTSHLSLSELLKHYQVS